MEIYSTVEYKLVRNSLKKNNKFQNGKYCLKLTVFLHSGAVILLGFSEGFSLWLLEGFLEIFSLGFLDGFSEVFSLGFSDGILKEFLDGLSEGISLGFSEGF